MTILNVVQLPVFDLREIPENLRRLADCIEAGRMTPSRAAVVLGFDGGSPELYGYGPDMDGLRMIGLLQLGIDLGIRNCMIRRDRTGESS